MARYLVTGGAGFVGSHVVDALVAADHQVRVLDDLSTGRLENIEAHHDVELVEGDLVSEDLGPVVAGMDCIVHLAAAAAVPVSIVAPMRTHEVNVDGMHRLLLAARGAGVRRVVLASSAAVYGNTNVAIKLEHDRPEPGSPYAVHKLIAEHYAALYSRLYGLQAVALRLFNVFGPRQRVGVVSVLAKALLDPAGCPTGCPTIYGDGEQTRDFVYATDAARAVLMACSSDAAPGASVLNVATGTSLSINDLYLKLQRLTGNPTSAVHAAPVHGDIAHSRANVQRVKRVLGWTAEVQGDEGLRRTVEWWRGELGRAPE